jgi:arylsulfatase A-like enzyme
LYDVVADPYELKNLADDPQHAKPLTELREKLKQWRLQQGEDLNKVPMPEDARHGDIPYAQ